MFIDREKEIARLQQALQHEDARLIVVYGRRRCGGCNKMGGEDFDSGGSTRAGAKKQKPTFWPKQKID